VTEHIVRSGFAFGFLVVGASAAVWALVSVPVRWIRGRRG
jgi:hypothetical protein